MTPTEPTFTDFLGSSGFCLAQREGTPKVVVSVRRTMDGHTTVRSWSLDSYVGDDIDERCRADAKSIADGTCTAGETLVFFSFDDGGRPVILQIGYGVLSR